MMATLRVLLNDLPVGELSLNSTDGADFRLFDSYKIAYPRPVLGQTFLDDLDRVHHVRGRTPPWFSNLLPEGMLRDLVTRQAGVANVREFNLLRHLADDLPGAVRLVGDADFEPAADPVGMDPAVARTADDLWHFSLAGVQLKFSAIRAGKGLTIPVSGVGGEWIVKLPDSRYAGVPDNEFATMQWARASGIDTPEFERLDIKNVGGLPAEMYRLPEQTVFAIRRFDRAGRERIHMEDFAQLLGLFPEQKYDRYNYETIGKMVHVLTGAEDFDEFVLRLVFVVMSGNGDAHHKNWSITYPDGLTARLSPAYDLVSTIHYLYDDRLALNLSQEKLWERIGAAAFHRLARAIDEPIATMDRRVAAAIERVMHAWAKDHGDFGYSAAMRETLNRHFRRVGLLRTASAA